MQRKLNLLLLLFSLLGGFAAYLAGEVLLGRWLGAMPSIVMAGIYFALIGLGTGLGCLLAEMISPELNGPSWRQRYVSLSWKLLPLTLVIMFAAGSLTEFVYELNFGGAKPVKNVVMVIDDSGSMNESDPGNRRYSAAEGLVRAMDEDNQVAVITFSDQAAVVKPLTPLDSRETRDNVAAAIAGLQTTTGGTNISGALSEAMNVIEGDGRPDSGSMVILLSDGFSQFDTGTELREFVDRGIKVNTVGLSLSDPSGTQLLRDIASVTAGQYYDVADAERLQDVFQQIYDRLGDRTLITERTDDTQDSPYYAGVRIVALLLIGAALGVGLGIVFDNRHLARSFGLGGAVSGLLAGLILEFGLGGGAFLDGLVRLAAVLALAGVIALFTLIVPVGEGRLTRRGRRDMPEERGQHGRSVPPRRGSKGF